MALSKLGQTLTALEILELVKSDLERVEREINLESVARLHSRSCVYGVGAPVEPWDRPNLKTA